MLDIKDKLHAKRTVCVSMLQKLSSEGGFSGLKDKIDEIKSTLKEVDAALVKCNSYISSCQKSIKVVESVRERATRFMTYAGSNPEKSESLFKWTDLVMRTNMILSLVDAEKKKEEEMTAKERELAAAKERDLAAARDRERAEADTSLIDLVESDDSVQTAGLHATAANAASESNTASVPISLPKPANSSRKGRKTKTVAPTDEERKAKEDADYIPFGDYLTQLNGGQKGAHDPIKDQSLVWKNGKVFCQSCDHIRITHKKNMYRHTQTATHVANLQRARASKTPLFQKGIELMDRQAMGSHQDSESLEYRFKVMIAAGLENVPIENIHGISKHWVNDYAGKTLGNQGDFVALTAPALREAMIDDMRTIIAGEGCFDEFAVTFDGTPSFAEAEAIVIRIVTKDWNVLEILVRCGLYEKKLNSDELKSHVIDTIKNRVGLKLKDWMSTHQDRAATNTAAIKKINLDEKDATPAKNDCCSHTFSNAAKKSLGEKGASASFSESYRKMFQAMINHPGKARDRFKEVTGETVKTAGGIRFFQKFEQVAQIHKSDPEKILSEMVQYCIDKKCSLESSIKMMREFDLSTDAKANLGMAIVELAAIAEGLKTFAEACYILEGDYSIILRAFDVFKRVEDQIQSGFDTPGLEAAVEKGLKLIQQVERDWVRKYSEAEEVVEVASASVSAAEEKLNALEEERESLTSNRSRSGRTSNRTNRTLDVDTLQTLCDDIVKGRIELQNATTAEKNAQSEFATMKDSFEEWKQRFPHRTFDSLLEHGKAILKPAADYYNKHYRSEEGDCFNIRQMVEAALIFDPVELRKLSDTEITTVNHYRADKLRFFRYKHFNDNFMKQLRMEMPKLVKEAKRDGELDEIKPSEGYKTRLQKRIQRKGGDDDDDDDTTTTPNPNWKDDAGEYAERIWQWWKPRRDDFPAHTLALRLVVLTQLSSCSVERVFSKLKMIRERCGENLYDDMCEVRLFLQCNGDLSDLAAKMKKE